jgi:hypothetical protein
MKHRRIQSAYKRILMEKMKDKDDRLRDIQERKEKIKMYQQKNGFNFIDFVKVSNQIESSKSIS